MAEDEQAREAELVRRIHRAVGGPAKLSTYDDPAAVRQVVLDALCAEYGDAEAQARVSRGDLTAFERRVVRTVTNRGAAVRSRMRQRRELARLRDELRRKDEHIAKLEATLASFTRAAPSGAAVRVPMLAPSPVRAPGADAWAAASALVGPSGGGGAAGSGSGVPHRAGTPSTQSSASVTPAVSPEGAGAVDADGSNGEETEAFGNLIDQMLSRI